MGNLQTLNQLITIGGVKIRNRIVMPPMDTNYANGDGSLSRKQLAYYTERARGGVGLIILEASSVSYPEGRISERQINMKSPLAAPEFHDLTDAVHGFGTKMIAQLHHGGFMAVPAYGNGEQNIAPSDYQGRGGSKGQSARQIARDEIKRVTDDFINAAKVARDGGFDGVELHAAHMYLLNQFLSPVCNQRMDRYGGSPEDRFRIVREILEGIRAACPRPFILSVRLGAVDAVPGGTALEEGVQYARWCEEAGADLINLSHGFYNCISKLSESQWNEEGNRVYLSAAVKKAVSIPVAIVGKLRTPGYMAEIIEEGKADLVCVGRQLICDPAFPNKIFTGRLEEIRPCLSCAEGCLGQFYFHHGNVRCSINPYVGYEDFYSESNVPKTGIVKRIAVVGGGISGMQFAIIAKKRGHEVTIFEKSQALGGQMALAAAAPHKESVAAAKAWFVSEVKRLGIQVQLGSEVTVWDLEGFRPDAVIVAAGSLPDVPAIAGIEHAVEAREVLQGRRTIAEGSRVVVIGGGIVGCELAHKLIEKQCRVTVLERLSELCRGHEVMHRAFLTGYLNKNAHVRLNATVHSVNSGSVHFTAGDGREISLEADAVIYSTGQHPVGEELVKALQKRGVEAYLVGDSMQPGNFRAATRAAMDLAYRI